MRKAWRFGTSAIALGFVFSGLFISTNVYANSGVTYHGRLLKPDGQPVSSSNVQFRIQIRTPSDSDCLMFEEVQTKDLSASGGLFSINIGDGSATTLNVEPYSLSEVFQNRKTIDFPAGKCQSSPTATLGAMASRQLRVWFNDGSFSGWESLPSQQINFVPLALDAVTVGGHSPSNFFRVEDAGDVQTMGAWSLANYQKLVSLVTNTSISGSNVSIGGNAAGFTGSLAGDVTGAQGTTKVERIQNHAVSATSPTDGQVLTWNNASSRWEPSTPAASSAPSGNAGGDLTGTYPGPTIAVNAVTTTKISNEAVTLAKLQKASADGQVHRFDGTDWQFAKLHYRDLVNNTSASPWPIADCTAGQAIVWQSATDSFACSSITIGSANITDGSIATADLADGSVTDAKIAGVAVNKITSGTGLYLTYAPDGVACLTGQVLKKTSNGWECGSDNSNNGTVTSVSGTAPIAVATGTSTPVISLNAGGVANSHLAADAVTSAKILDGTIVDADIAAGTITASKLATSVTDGLWAASGGNVSRATGNVGIGISVPTDKLEVGGRIRATHICAADGTNCKDLTSAWAGGSVTSVSGTAPIAVTGGASTPTVSLNAGGVANSHLAADAVTSAKIQDGTIATADLADLSVTNQKISGMSVDKVSSGAGLYLTYAPNGAACLTGQVLKKTSNGWECGTDTAGTGTVTNVATGSGLTGGPITGTGTISIANGGVSNAHLAADAVNSAKIQDGTVLAADMDFAGLNNSSSTIVLKDGTGKFNSFACTTPGHVPTWTATGFVCQAPSITETDPKIGANTLNMLSKWDGTRMVASAVYENGGNVGMGTSSPEASSVLELSSTTKGFLPPRMTTTNRDAISSPATGLLIYNTDLSALQIFNGSSWSDIGSTSVGGMTVLDSGTISGTATLTRTFNFAQDYVVIFSASFSGSNYPMMTLSTDGTSCSTDRSYIASGSNFGSAACTKVFTAGSHTIRSVYTETSGNANMVSHSMNYVVFAKTSGGPSVQWDASGSDISYSAGLVGIGTATPADRLDVAGRIRATHLCAPDGTNCKDLTTAWAGGSVTGVTSANSDIGVSSPNLAPVLTLNSGVGANQILKLNASSQIPAVSGALLTDLNATNVTAGTLAAARLPGLTGDVTSASGTNSTSVEKIRGRNVAAAAPTNGQVLKWSTANSQWEPSVDTAGTGTVTSVGVGVPAYMTSSGGPVTSSGTINLGFGSQAQNLVFASPVAASGAPSFRGLQISDIRSSVAGAFLTGGACGAGQALVYTLPSDTVSCQTISGVAPGGAAGGDLTGTYPNPTIATGAVNSAKIQDGSIATADIGDSQVTDAKIAGLAVNKISSAAGQYFTYAPSGAACTTGQVLKKTSNGWECGTDTVGTGTVTSVATGSGLTGGTISTTGTISIANGGVGETHLAASSVTTAKILDGTIQVADMNFTGANNGTAEILIKDSTGKFNSFGCATAGHVPTWTVAGFICAAPTETDPKIGANTTNMLSKWDGSRMIASTVHESGGNVGIGTTSPGARLTVAGTIETTAGGVKFPDGQTQAKAVVLGDHLCPVGQYLRGWDASGIKICVPASAGDVNQTYIHVSVGYLVTCAIRSDNLTQCWGYNTYGELGNATNVASPIPVRVRKYDGTYFKAKKLITGVNTTCAIQASDDRVYCWGYGANGQLGNGAYANKNMATPVSNLGAVKDITHTHQAFCAVDTSDLVWCWGFNSYYGLGNGTTTASAVPTPTLDQSTGTQLSGMNRLAGVTGSAACAYNDTVGNPKIYCWGYNGSGEAGDGTTGGYVQRAKSVSMTAMVADGVDQIVSVVGGGDNNNWRNSFCAIGRTAASTYKAYCWGYNAYGNLMISGDQAAKTVPTVATYVGAKSAPFQLLMNPYTSCMLSGGIVQCAGYGGRGDLGNGAAANSYPFVTVRPIGGGTGSFAASSLAVSTGSYDGLGHACAISTEGLIGCWGLGTNGQLGNNATSNSTFPVGMYQE